MFLHTLRMNWPLHEDLVLLQSEDKWPYRDHAAFGGETQAWALATVSPLGSLSPKRHRGLREDKMSSKDASIFRLLYHERGWERREHQEAKDSRNHRTFTLDETREATPRVYFPTPSNPQQLTFLWTLPVTGAVSYAVGAQELPACLQ